MVRRSGDRDASPAEASPAEAFPAETSSLETSSVVTLGDPGGQDAPAPLVLVVNAGSSSLKASLVGTDGHRPWQGQQRRDPDDPAAIEALLEAWLMPAISPWSGTIARVAHRVVHGGEQFTRPTRLTAAVMGSLEALEPLAPLHNGPALRAIRWFASRLVSPPPALEQWACFDTGFHASLPEPARTYAIPAAWRAAGLRRYGFHGLNHQHVAETVAARHPELRRLISCHLGAGCSLCAIGLDPVSGARSLDTTMGFTPLEGLVMASRSGSVDPGLLLHQLRRGLAPEAIDEDLNHRSGLLGLSGLSGDMRELRQAAASGHAAAQLALDVFLHRLLQGIGAMAASLGGVDAIALTGGIGEHDDALEGELRQRLGWLGPCPLLRVPADEEGLMARLVGGWAPSASPPA
ncbi:MULTISPECIES: acetate/propionate family kinase [Aphanothece]|uniref:acetate/propionate family kinase n=1 Tax=Aphanothece TaxID=1121 RepID=UPI0039855EB5